MNVHVKVPGKVMLAGEWNVLLPGHSCIALAVNKYACCTIVSSEQFKLIFQPFNYATFFSFQKGRVNHIEDKQFSLAFKAAEITLQYISTLNQPIKPFALTVDTSSFYSSGVKIGLGSSSASVVGIITSILVFHGVSVKNYDEKMLVFKLSALAQLQVNSHTSCYDIAVSVFGDVVYYASFNRESLLKNYNSSTNSLREITTLPFSGLQIKKLCLSHFNFLVCATGKASSTTNLVGQVYENLEKNKQFYFRYLEIMDNIETVVQKLVVCVEQGNDNDFFLFIKENRKLLQQFQQLVDITLETEDLTSIITVAEQYGCVCKLSGAGGGDVAIILSEDKNQFPIVSSALLNKGFYPLSLTLDHQGVCYGCR